MSYSTLSHTNHQGQQGLPEDCRSHVHKCNVFTYLYLFTYTVPSGADGLLMNLPTQLNWCRRVIYHKSHCETPYLSLTSLVPSCPSSQLIPIYIYQQNQCCYFKGALHRAQVRHGCGIQLE